MTTYLDRLLELVASENFSVAPAETLETLERGPLPQARHNVDTKKTFPGFQGAFPANEEKILGGREALPKSNLTTTDTRKLFRDYETGSPLDLTKCGAEIYAAHPDTRVWCHARRLRLCRRRRPD
jgi:hypothetical protein